MGLLGLSDDIAKATDDLINGGEDGVGFFEDLTAVKAGKGGLAGGGVVVGGDALTDITEAHKQNAKTDKNESETQQQIERTRQGILNDETLTIQEKMALIDRLSNARQRNQSDDSSDDGGSLPGFDDPMVLIIGIIVLVFTLRYALDSD